jgi:hypothetical protein
MSNCALPFLKEAIGKGMAIGKASDYLAFMVYLRIIIINRMWSKCLRRLGCDGVGREIRVL